MFYDSEEKCTMLPARVSFIDKKNARTCVALKDGIMYFFLTKNINKEQKKDDVQPTDTKQVKNIEREQRLFASTKIETGSPW